MTTTRYPYSVVQPIEDGPTRLTTARVISRHRTRATAWRAIVRAKAKLRRLPGQEWSWLDWVLREEG